MRADPPLEPGNVASVQPRGSGGAGQGSAGGYGFVSDVLPCCVASGPHGHVALARELAKTGGVLHVTCSAPPGLHKAVVRMTYHCTSSSHDQLYDCTDATLIVGALQPPS